MRHFFSIVAVTLVVAVLVESLIFYLCPVLGGEWVQCVFIALLVALPGAVLFAIPAVALIIYTDSRDAKRGVK